MTASVDTVELIRTFATAAHVSYRMLADPTGKVAQDTGIRDLQYVVGASAFGVPQPGIFVLAKDGKILAKFVMQGYKVRPDPDEVLTAVRGLAKQRPSQSPPAGRSPQFPPSSGEGCRRNHCRFLHHGDHDD